MLSQLQQAAEDVSQLAVRFGYKMVKTLQRRDIINLLFADRKLLRLPCLQYADNFACRATKSYGKERISYRGSAPLLWWLWDEFLEWLLPGHSWGRNKFEFTSARETDIALPYLITTHLAYKREKDNIELTASYGGRFHEQRVFDAPVANFRIPGTKRYGKVTTATLSIDRHMYQGEGCLDHTFDYLMSRPGSIWRHAMKAFPLDKDVELFVALAGTCGAKDDVDVCRMSETQARSCLNLVQRFPPDAKKFINDEELVGKTCGPYSISANEPDPFD